MKLKSSYPAVCSRWLHRMIDMSRYNFRMKFYFLSPFKCVTGWMLCQKLDFSPTHFCLCLSRRRKGRRVATYLAAPPSKTLCSLLPTSAKKTPRPSWTSTCLVSWRLLAASHRAWLVTRRAQALQIGRAPLCPSAMDPPWVVILWPPKFWWRAGSPQSIFITTTSIITTLRPRPRSRLRLRQLSVCSASALQQVPVILTSPQRKCNFWRGHRYSDAPSKFLRFTCVFISFSHGSTVCKRSIKTNGEGGSSPRLPLDTTDRSQNVWQWILESERQGKHKPHR